MKPLREACDSVIITERYHGRSPYSLTGSRWFSSIISVLTATDGYFYPCFTDEETEDLKDEIMHLSV